MLNVRSNLAESKVPAGISDLVIGSNCNTIFSLGISTICIGNKVIFIPPRRDLTLLLSVVLLCNNKCKRSKGVSTSHIVFTVGFDPECQLVHVASFEVAYQWRRNA